MDINKLSGKIIGAAIEACPPPARHCYMAIAGGLQAQARWAGA